jgi:biotin operon repressor
MGEQIHNQVMDAMPGCRLHWPDRLVLWLLAYACNDDSRGCMASQEWLCNVTALHAAAIDKAINRLEKDGWIVRTDRGIGYHACRIADQLPP